MVSVAMALAVILTSGFFSLLAVSSEQMTSGRGAVRDRRAVQDAQGVGHHHGIDDGLLA